MPLSDARLPLPFGLPLTLTVAEAAELLRISKGGVYDLTRRWVASGGEDGLPIVRLGLDRTRRIPTVAVLRLVGVLETPQPEATVEAKIHPLRRRGGDGAA